VRRVVRRALRESGCQLELCNVLVLAVDEACSNVIRHSYGAGERGDIDLEIVLRTQELEFRVADGGRRVDPTVLASEPPATLKPGGLGIPLIRRIMDDVRYENPPRGRTNLLVMRKLI